MLKIKIIYNLDRMDPIKSNTTFGCWYNVHND